MKKTLSIFVLSMTLLSFSYELNSQEMEIEIPKNDRYIVIENYDSFFNHEDGLTKVQFELINIFDNESSKPIFVDVSELNNVVKISIKSTSAEIANQRSCFLTLKSQNYLYTFILALDKMDVKYVYYENELLTTQDFFTLKTK